MQTYYIYSENEVPQLGLNERKTETPVNVQFETGRIANMFDQYDSTPPSGSLIFTAQRSIEVTVTYQLLFDAYSKLFPPVKKELSLIAGDTALEVTFPEVGGKFGVFRLTVCVHSNNTLLCRKRFSFSRALLPEAPDRSVGLSVHLFAHARTEILELLKKIGIGSIRDDISWGRVEKEKGVIKPFPEYDITADAVKRLGIEPLLILNYGNGFYDNGKNPHSDEAISAFARFCYETAKHYRGIISSFEIFNEYNLLAFNPERRDQADYTRMLKAAYKAIKAAAPDAVVCTAGTCNGHPAWLKGILDCGAYEYFDAVGIHPYCSSQGPVYPDHGRVREEVEEYRKIIRNYGKEKPVTVTEIGWKTNAGGGGGRPAFQAEAIIRNLALSQSSEEPYMIYTYTDSDGTNPFDAESHFGILESSCTESPYALKEAAVALAAWTSLAAGGALKSIISSGCIYGYSISGKDGTDTNIIWSRNGLQDVTVKSNAEKLDVYDLYGAKHTYFPKNGLTNITVGDQPMYIRAGNNALSLIEVKEKEEPKYREEKISIRIEPEYSPQSGWQVKLTVSNSYEREITGILTVFDENKRLIRDALRVKSNSKSEILKEISVTDSLTPKSISAELITTDGELINVTERIRFWGIPYLAAEDFFTADCGEKVCLDERAYVRIAGKESDAIKAELRFGWNEDYLLIGGDVTDDIHAQNGLDSPVWKDIWDGDGLQFSVAPDGTAEESKKSYSEFGAALSSVSGEITVWRWRAPENRSVKRYTAGKCSITRTENHTHYKIAIRWADILPRGYSIENTRVIAFALNVNNASDLTNDLVGYLHFGNGVGCRTAGIGGNPTQLDTVLLIKNKEEF